MGPIRERFKHGMWLVNRKHRQPARWRFTAAALVCLMMVVSASQGMVLCFGAHGHVAIEPAGHRHCDGTIHYDDHDYSAESTHGDAVLFFTLPQYDSCVDIPLPISPPREKPTSSALKTAVVVAIAEPPAVSQNLGLRAVALSDGLHLAQDTLWSTIVLQV